MLDALTLTRAAAAWALGFYRRHFLLVFGLSLIPTGQRFLVVRYEPPTPVAIGTEVVVTLVRVLLVACIAVLMLRELGAAGIDRQAAWTRIRAGIDGRRAGFWLQGVVLAAAFAAFDIVPNLLVAAAVPPADRPTVTAVLVAIKNPTVIAGTFLWLVGIARTLIVEPADPRRYPSGLGGTGTGRSM